MSNNRLNLAVNFVLKENRKFAGGCSPDKLAFNRKANTFHLRAISVLTPIFSGPHRWKMSQFILKAIFENKITDLLTVS